MKVWVHTMYYLPEFGSAPILMNELAVYLKEKGHDVEVVTTIPRPPHHKKYRWKLFNKDETDGFPVRRYRTNFTIHHIGRLIAWTVYTKWAILNLRRVKRGDVLFLRLPPLQLGITGAFARRLRGAGVLLSVQDIHPDLSIESGLLKKGWAIGLAQRFEKWIYRKSDEIAVISDGFRQNLLEKDVQEDKLHIVPNWVDTDLLRPYPKDNPVAQKFLLQDKFVAMYSGTISLSSYVTLEKVLEAAKKLEGSNHFQLVIVGEGLKKPDLVAKAEELKLKNVNFLPFQPYEDLPYLLSASDVLLVPLDPEKTQLSVPSKLYNYMAIARPVLGLTDDTSEVARIIDEAGGGVNAEPEDVDKMAEKLKELMAAPEKCLEYGRNARKYVEEGYAKDVVLKKYEELMLSLGNKQ